MTEIDESKVQATAQEAPKFNNNITVEEILDAQKAWGVALMKISKAHREGGIEAARAEAEAALDASYGYDLGPVLFKPTLSSGEQTFRVTREGALSYFVGHNPDYPGDNGFALRKWEGYRNENAAFFIEGNVGTVMGKVFLQDTDGNETVVDKTWQYRKDDKGTVRIVVHHSSLEYAPAEDEKKVAG
ncbi:MAG: phosphoribosyl-AMP cyclohydrolase [Paracoccus sp. (in: a-proteobacteria)]|nr:phosphoribosyl-AMP cyclohydrolase [Paracoccus sp. (in: a-proteobacteria)]